MEPKYVIGEKNFVFSMTLEQDELLGAISYEMIRDEPGTLTRAGEGMIDLADEVLNEEAVRVRDEGKGLGEKMGTAIRVALDMIKVHAWIYKKGYAKKILAITLVPEGEEFDASKIGELESFFGKHANRETANEVINFFFQRSGAFGIGTRAFSPAAMTTK
jgi:hypothetical protein